MCPVGLDNEDIKAREDERLIFDKQPVGKLDLYPQGIQVPPSNDRDIEIPITLLIPDFRSQTNNHGMSFVNITTLIDNLLIVSAKGSSRSPRASNSPEKRLQGADQQRKAS